MFKILSKDKNCTILILFYHLNHNVYLEGLAKRGTTLQLPNPTYFKIAPKLALHNEMQVGFYL